MNSTMLQTPPTGQDQRPLKWYQGLERYCWIVLAIAALGWMFDMMDQNLYTLIRVPSLRDILSKSLSGPALDAAVKAKGGVITAVFLIGWSVGGFIFGILGDRIGRTKTMILTILTYAIFTGINGMAHSWEMYAFARFMTALGVGGEWAAGASLVAEVFPQRSRAMALGMLQSLSAVGNMMASLVTLAIGNFGDMSKDWRWVYFLGAAPAILIFWIFKSVKEPETWQQARKEAAAGKEMGNIGELFSNPKLRHNLIVAVLLAAAGVGGLWGVGYFSPDMLTTELKAAKWDGKHIATSISIMFLLQQIGAFAGMYLFAPFAEKKGRRPAFFLWYTLSWISVLVFFWGLNGAGAAAYPRALVLAPILGFCTLGPLTGFTIYFPELFPTRLRATGCGFGYNAARILAAVAPFALGSLAATFAQTGPKGEVIRSGYAAAASIVSFIYILGFIGTVLGPETRGKGLPPDSEFE